MFKICLRYVWRVEFSHRRWVSRRAHVEKFTRQARKRRYQIIWTWLMHEQIQSITIHQSNNDTVELRARELLSRHYITERYRTLTFRILPTLILCTAPSLKLQFLSFLIAPRKKLEVVSDDQFSKYLQISVWRCWESWSEWKHERFVTLWQRFQKNSWTEI